MTRPENKSLLIKGGHLIDPAAKINAPMDVLLRDGRVAEIAAPNKTRGAADEKFDARGLIVAPGFVDLHVHLREPGQSYKETIATGTAWETAILRKSAASSRATCASATSWFVCRVTSSRPFFP